MADISANDLRARAAHCRELAKGSADPVTSELLLAMADDFDAEAAHLEPRQQIPPPKLES